MNVKNRLAKLEAAAAARRIGEPKTAAEMTDDELLLVIAKDWLAKAPTEAIEEFQRIMDELVASPATTEAQWERLEALGVLDHTLESAAGDGPQAAGGPVP